MTSAGLHLPRFDSPTRSAAGSPESHARRPSPGRSTASSKLSKCKSAPSVAGCDSGLFSIPFSGSMWEAERHRRYVMFSPQGLFARTVPPPRFGANASERFHQLGLQEARYQARRAAPGDGSRPSSGRSVRSDGGDHERCGATPRKLSKESVWSHLSRPGSSKTEAFEPAVDDEVAAPGSAGEPGPGGHAPHLGEDAATFREMQNRRDCFDFREGLRVAILGTKPAPLGADKVWPPPPEECRPATREETLKAYKQYNEWMRMQEGDQDQEEDEFMIAIDNLLVSDAGGPDLMANLEHCPDDTIRVSRVDHGPLADWNADCKDNPEDAFRIARPGDRVIEVNGFRGGASEMMDMCMKKMLLHLVIERPRRLGKITWGTFNEWAYMQAYLSDTAREKAVYASMYKAHKAYLRYQMRAKMRTHGLTLTGLMRWLWPSLRPADIATMYTWLTHHELESIRQETPRVISPETRRQIEGIFQEMDWGKKGVLTPQDFSGGENQDITVQLKNCVDDATVQKVLGEGTIDLPRFLELMCEDSYRGHDKSRQAIRKDGRYVVEQVRELIGFRGWVFSDVPKEEQPIRRRVDSLEAEVKMWRLIARGKVREREADRGPLNN